MLYMQRQSGRCYWCGCVLTRGGTQRPRSRTKDHLVPTARGGGTGTNKVSCCWTCNQRKGDMTAEEYVAYVHQQ